MKYYKGDFCPRVQQMGFLEDILTPEVKQSLVGSATKSAKDAIDVVWQQYKLPIISVGSILAVTLILENMANIKILTSK